MELRPRTWPRIVRRQDWRDLTPEQIKAIRQRLNLSQGQFAGLLEEICRHWSGAGTEHFHQQTVQRWEVGTSRPTPYTGPAILIAATLPPREFGRDHPPQPEDGPDQ